MRFHRALCAFGLLALSATGFAETEKDSWLIRMKLPQPTPAEVSTVLGVPVTRVEHVVDDLYRVVVAHGDSGMLGPVTNERSLLAARAARNAPGEVTHIQHNHIYHIELSIPAEAYQKLQDLIRVYGPVAPEARHFAKADKPDIKDPVAHPESGKDPKVDDQWSMHKINGPEAWSQIKGTKKIVVAVIDTGVDYNHEDLRANLWRNTKTGENEGEVGWDAVDDDGKPYDQTSQLRIDGNPGHGTHCSGVIGAVANNALGVHGVAVNVEIMAMRFIDETGNGTTANAVKAIKWAVAHGANILSNSWGGEKDSEDDTELKQVIQDAGKAGVLFVAAAGNGHGDAGVGYDNDTDPKPTIPASYPYDNIISVASIGQDDALSAFSNWGKTSVDIAAPGEKVLSTVPGDSYEDTITVFGIPLAPWDGTSMSAPHVSGAAALVWSEHPDESMAQIRQRLLDHARKVDGLADKIATGGILDVAAAMQ